MYSCSNRYATKSKRVNVGKLKKDLWTQLDTKVPVLAADATEAADDAELSRCVSFRGVVEDIDREQQSSEVTVSFYFICLLHLANEKVQHKLHSHVPILKCAEICVYVCRILRFVTARA